MDTHKKMRVHLSALVDGESSPADLELAMAALHTADGQQTWNAYYRIGDELRAQGNAALSDEFAAKLTARLSEEPVPLRRNAQKNGDGTGTRRVVARASVAGRRAASSSAPTSPTAPKRDSAGTATNLASDELSIDGKAVVISKPAIASVS